MAGLSFGAEKALKKIFGSGIPPGAVELYHIVKQLSPAQKKEIKDALFSQGYVGSGQVGGFLGMLASLGILLAIELVRKVIEKGIHIQPPKGKLMHIKKAAGIRLEPPPPPPVLDLGKKKIVDVPLSNFDLLEWCERLNIPLKGIFARNEKMGKNHSPCIVNLDSIEGFGTHWVCCWHGNHHFEYFDSFGLPPPLEWEENVKKWFPKMKTFLRNNFQIQDFLSGYVLFV